MIIFHLVIIYLIYCIFVILVFLLYSIMISVVHRHISYWWNWFFSQVLHFMVVDLNKQEETNARALTDKQHMAHLRLTDAEGTIPIPMDKPVPTRMTTLCHLNHPKLMDERERMKELEEIEIKIVNWNIHEGFDGSYNHTFMDQCEYLSALDADIVCLQEVNNRWHSIPVGDNEQDRVNQTVFLSRYCKYPYYVQYHNMAILSRFPIIHTHHIKDNVWHMGYGSHAIVADILLDPSDEEDSSRTLSVYNCHLNNDLVGYEQWHFVHHTSLIPELLTLSYNRLPLVICGDFNSVSWYSGLQLIRRTLCYPPKHEIWTHNRPTFPVAWPMLKLDRIYTNQNTHQKSCIKFISNYVDYECKKSDHHPLVSFYAVD